MCDYTREERGCSGSLWYYIPVGVLPTMDLQQVDMVDTLTADDRGRVTIGSEYAGEDLKVYVERVDTDA